MVSKKKKMAEKWDSTFWSMRETFYFACKVVLKNISKNAKKTRLSFWFLSFFKISTFSSCFYRKCGKNTQKWFCSHRFRWFLLVTRKPPRRFRETLVARNRAASLWEFLRKYRRIAARRLRDIQASSQYIEKHRFRTWRQ